MRFGLNLNEHWKIANLQGPSPLNVPDDIVFLSKNGQFNKHFPL